MSASSCTALSSVIAFFSLCNRIDGCCRRTGTLKVKGDGIHYNASGIKYAGLSACLPEWNSWAKYHCRRQTHARYRRLQAFHRSALRPNNSQLRNALSAVPATGTRIRDKPGGTKWTRLHCCQMTNSTAKLHYRQFELPCRQFRFHHQQANRLRM